MHNNTETLTKGSHSVSFTFNQKKPMVFVSENWEGQFLSSSDLALYRRRVRKETARRQWKEYIAKGYQKKAKAVAA